MDVLGLAILYLGVWWLTLFAVLPWGNRPPDHNDDTVRGSAGSAPARPRIKRKLLVNTLIATLVFAAIIAVSRSGITLDDIPLPSPPPLE